MGISLFICYVHENMNLQKFRSPIHGPNYVVIFYTFLNFLIISRICSVSVPMLGNGDARPKSWNVIEEYRLKSQRADSHSAVSRNYL